MANQTYMIALDYDSQASFSNVVIQPACPDGIVPGRTLTGGDFKTVDDGHYSTKWEYSVLTRDDYISLITQFDLLDQRSRQVTILTRDHDTNAGTHTAWNATIIKPSPKMKPAFGLFESVIFDIVGMRKTTGDFNTTDWNEDWNW